MTCSSIILCVYCIVHSTASPPVALVEVLADTPPPLQPPAAAAVVAPPAGVGVRLRLPGQLLVPAELEHV